MWSLLSLVTAQIITGINITGSKFLIEYLSVFMLLAIRFIIGSLFLLIFILLFRRNKLSTFSSISKYDYCILITQALCAGILFNFLMLVGIEFSTASMAGLITSVLPAVIIILSFVLFKEKMTLFKFLSLIFATLGLLTINFSNIRIDVSKFSLFGDLIIFIAMIPEAFYYVLSKFKKVNLPPIESSFIMNLVNTVAIIPFIFIINWKDLFLFNLNVYIILLMVSCSSMLFYFFWFWGCNKVSLSTSSIITAVMPISTMIFSFLFLGEVISCFQLCGMFLIFFSIFFSSKKIDIIDYIMQYTFILFK